MLHRYWWVFAVMIVLTPLGLLGEGTAWGEWGAEDINGMLGYVPVGIQQSQSWWQAAFPDYTMSFLGEGGIVGKAAYALSGAIGAGLVYFLILLYGKMLVKANAK